jgi:hypothetical protein
MTHMALLGDSVIDNKTYVGGGPDVTEQLRMFAPKDYGMSVELPNIDQRVAKIETTLQQLAKVVVLTARQDERLIAIERRVDRLAQAPAHR